MCPEPVLASDRFANKTAQKRALFCVTDPGRAEDVLVDQPGAHGRVSVVVEVPAARHPAAVAPRGAAVGVVAWPCRNPFHSALPCLSRAWLGIMIVFSIKCNAKRAFSHRCCSSGRCTPQAASGVPAERSFQKLMRGEKLREKEEEARTCWLP
jgi:hypothetical protein